VGNPIEPRAFLASFDESAGFTVYTPSQGMNNMRGFLSAATGLPVEKIRVITELVGGSFGIRSYSYAEHVACMLAAQKLAGPVKWVATRSEVFLSDNQGRGLTMTAELALDADGGFLALRFDDRADLGAFSTPFGPQIGSRNITITMGGVYRVPAMYARTRCAYSNVVSMSAYRGAGAPTSPARSSAWSTAQPPSTASTRSSCAGRTSSRPRRCPTRPRTARLTIRANLKR